MAGFNGTGVQLIGGPPRCQGPHMDRFVECPKPAAFDIAAPGVQPRSVCASCSLIFRIGYLEKQMVEQKQTIQHLTQQLLGGNHGQEKGRAEPTD